MGKKLISYSNAVQITLENIVELGSERVPLSECVDRIAFNDLNARVSSPSVDASLKDGYAIRSDEIEHATPENPVQLEVLGMAAAGTKSDYVVRPGTAVRILTGAKVPKGATAIVSEEFTTVEDQSVWVTNFSEIGRNILPRGSDVAVNQRICKKGEWLVPGLVGILAAAGHNEIPVYCRPNVAIIATGDEVVVPGRPLPEGKLYASNLVTLDAWCKRYGMQTVFDIVDDRPQKIKDAIQKAVANQDAVLTSGGAWTGDRDFVAGMLDELGWKQFFHRVRIGPGKAVGFGLLNEKPIFILPGGPPSNLLAFLQIALPGLLKLGGCMSPKLPEVKIELKETVTARDVDWTQLVFGRFEEGGDHTVFNPLRLKSRLQSMAMAQGVVCVPEGKERLLAGSVLSAQRLI